MADGSHRLVAADFDRNEYVSGLDAWGLPWRPDGAPADASAAWSSTTVDQDLAGRWRALGELPPDAIGRRVHEFYVAWFAFRVSTARPHRSWPNTTGCTARRLGTTVESELEVFGFIARASDDRGRRCSPWPSPSSRPACSAPPPGSSRPTPGISPRPGCPPVSPMRCAGRALHGQYRLPRRQLVRTGRAHGARPARPLRRAGEVHRRRPGGIGRSPWDPGGSA